MGRGTVGNSFVKIPKTGALEQVFLPDVLAESPVSDLTDSVTVGTGEGTYAGFDYCRNWISQVTLFISLAALGIQRGMCGF